MARVSDLMDLKENQIPVKLTVRVPDSSKVIHPVGYIFDANNTNIALSQAPKTVVRNPAFVSFRSANVSDEAVIYSDERQYVELPLRGIELDLEVFFIL